ncbi:hypothetical protein D9M68_638310 [compost metagenome]
MPTDDLSDPPSTSDSSTSGVAWAAIFAGATAAAALSLVLLMLGVGLGFSAISPWVGYGTKATTLGASTIVWLAFTQLAASGFGGYLAGRLRVKWSAVHTDEVYFRDTAHGFLAWGIASLATAAFLTTAINAVVIGGSVPAAMAGQSSAPLLTAASPDSNEQRGGYVGYYGDMLWRTDQPPATVDEPSHRAEAREILTHSVRSGRLTNDDQQYLTRQVMRWTGLGRTDAEKRVAATYNLLSKTLKDEEVAARLAADKARKAAAYSSLWMFVALLGGAFFASLCATFGGRQRDHVAALKRQTYSEPPVRQPM